VSPISKAERAAGHCHSRFARVVRRSRIEALTPDWDRFPERRATLLRRPLRHRPHFRIGKGALGRPRRKCRARTPTLLLPLARTPALDAAHTPACLVQDELSLSVARESAATSPSQTRSHFARRALPGPPPRGRHPGRPQARANHRRGHSLPRASTEAGLPGGGPRLAATVALAPD
jgi:hypothetical protein